MNARPDGEFGAIDALLARSGPKAPLPPPARRAALREALNLSKTELARTLGVSAATVRAWEQGRDPEGSTREKYAYFLDAARDRLAALTPTTPLHDTPTQPDPAQPESELAHPGPAQPGGGEGELGTARPCVLCGGPARHQVEGFPQHLTPEECTTPAPSATPAPPAPESPAPAPAPGRSPRPVRGAQPLVARGRRAEGPGQVPDLVADAVRTALLQHGGDPEAATAALVKKAIPDAMALLDHCRIGGRYDVIAHPPLPEILRPQKARGADLIWEARPKWTRPWLPPGRHEVSALDLNGAYLSALKTHLPLGRLEHHTGPAHDRRRAGVHLITPPDWHHDDVLPHPLGQRDEPGPLWVTEPTLRLLLRLSGPRHSLCEAPVIHESFTSGASEGLLEKFRLTLKDARDRALAADDTVTLEYVKAMYAKFVATMGTSHYNRELYRPDWMHLIRSQAFANLWLKAFRAHESGLLVIRAMGTDELHVAGDWRRVFTEGRALSEVKVKDTYPLGDDHPPTPTTDP
ncbi:helix-turn-helix domain-containing protein [Streptomyces sp. SCSIO ZS0520]|uniref:helix-turn-helix domain-containing protein n=1 Tax=Streptomyces sp. SCSIO ZS0520 TaxID=2892996 RepID=UPI0021D9CA5C|nr:helix-turn-helix domain-containing protein [Streptomyces sp. SCSIO ZS0520]